MTIREAAQAVVDCWVKLGDNAKLDDLTLHIERLECALWDEADPAAPGVLKGVCGTKGCRTVVFYRDPGPTVFCNICQTLRAAIEKGVKEAGTPDDAPDVVTRIDADPEEPPLILDVYPW
jgi:hypothetical protein